ncbi:lysophospholipid acyltransferase family protein [Amphritea sp. 1_MG-2023]|uniref:lysophospholipid acyltransferase family protein n=1 Tax=Amphritea sp. 1_MG-2023 TaxID=3062670 RepID=UPI0026E2A145|nr:lysophospholipid acyltransferase family protein [Amphritea sp. 1_MG-2023]MDO6562357.1 lysophospholipid acyltransferase family protein [Amphritea sp. 1_MG-2023]
MKHLKGWLSVAVLYLLAMLPFSLAQKVGEWVGLRAYRKQGKSYRITQANINLCFSELESAAQDQLVKESLLETGKLAGEMGMAWMWSPDRVIKKIHAVHNEQIMTQAVAAGRGVILIAPHLGNWEVLGLYLSIHYPLTSMYRPPKIELMDRLIKKQRARMGSKLAPANIKGVRMAMKALKAGEVLGVLPDQEADKGSGVFVPFFGQDAYSMKLLPQLAAQTGAVVVAAYAQRLPNAEGFEIFFANVSEDINSKDLTVSATAMNAAVEQCVRQVPEQYQWEYKRFQHRSDGSRLY